MPPVSGLYPTAHFRYTVRPIRSMSTQVRSLASSTSSAPSTRTRAYQRATLLRAESWLAPGPRLGRDNEVQWDEQLPFTGPDFRRNRLLCPAGGPRECECSRRGSGERYWKRRHESQYGHHGPTLNNSGGVLLGCCCWNFARKRRDTPPLRRKPENPCKSLRVCLLPRVTMQLLSLRDHHGTRLRILLQQFGDGGFERIQFAGALPASRAACRCDQVVGNRSTSQVEMTGDLAHGPVFGPVQVMNRVDLFRGQHDSAATV